MACKEICELVMKKTQPKSLEEAKQIIPRLVNKKYGPIEEVSVARKMKRMVKGKPCWPFHMKNERQFKLNDNSDIMLVASNQIGKGNVNNYLVLADTHNIVWKNVPKNYKVKE